MSFVCNFVDPRNNEEFWGCGETVQEAWDNMLFDNKLEEEQVELEYVSFFEEIEVTRETKTVWEVSPDF